MAREKRWSRPNGGPLGRTRNTLVALVLASATLMTLDQVAGANSPLEPVRRAVGEVMGPVEKVTAEAVRPFTAVGDYFASRDSLRRQVRALDADNTELRQRVASESADARRLAEYDGLLKASSNHRLTLVPARVIGYGAAQSFTRTVTIDAGSVDGIAPDQAVVNNQGLVGRVIRVTRSTATVVLLIDPRTTVGGRIAESSELGTVSGGGSLLGDGTVDFQMFDSQLVPAQGDTVLTWGDAGGAYPQGLVIGRVKEVFTSVRDTSRRAVLEPAVDFSSLDLVGVAVPAGTTGARALMTPEGDWK